MQKRHTGEHGHSAVRASLTPPNLLDWRDYITSNATFSSRLRMLYWKTNDGKVIRWIQHRSGW